MLRYSVLPVSCCPYLLLSIKLKYGTINWLVVVFSTQKFFLTKYVEPNPSREVNVRWATFMFCSEVHNSIHKKNLPYPLLNQTNPVNMIHFFKTISNIIPKGLFLRGFLTTLWWAFRVWVIVLLVLSFSSTCLVTPNDVRWRVQIMWLLIMSLSTASFVSLRIILSFMLLNRQDLCSSRNVESPSFTTTRNIM